MRLSFLLSVGVVLVACKTDVPEEEPVVTLGPVTEKGAFAVGTFADAYIDSTGVEIPVQVWYPTLDETGVSVVYDDFYPGDSWELANPECASARPVVMFSHGNTGIRWQSAFLMDFLSSHGFVVVAMDHVTNTFLDHDGAKFPNHVLQRPRNVSESYDWLLDQSADAESQLAGCASEDDGYAVAGHSFGGYTSYVTGGATLSIPLLQTYCDGGADAACVLIGLWQEDHPESQVVDLGDDRVWAAVGLAPWDAFSVLGEGMSDIKIDVLTLTGTDDETTPLSMVSGLVAALGETPNDFGKLADTGHFSFSPIACQMMAGDGCGEEYLDLEIVKDLTNQSVTSFLGRSLGMAGASEQFPVVSEHVTWE